MGCADSSSCVVISALCNLLSCDFGAQGGDGGETALEAVGFEFDRPHGKVGALARKSLDSRLYTSTVTY